ncbi:hypothetical protein AB4Z50_14460 [Paenibacillus sp. 2TAB26]|uniref:hypothetical protein n=1 Tax=Paenibacillus sp. 2TAB26 TaxID=3233005 RepID=UPI003F9E9017
MEISWLLADEICIEYERMQLEQTGMTWKTIKDTLNAKYRENSKKGLFRCLCCNAKTTMRLCEDKACHFSHENKEDCAGQRNYTRYATATTNHESLKHRVGKAIIKNQLVSGLSRTDAIVIDGYLHNDDLSYVPDFIAQWPTGEVWTFDYVTGTKNAKYQRYLQKKQELYHSKNFKSYFLFDHSQIAYKEAQNALALSLSEKGSLSFLKGDSPWEGLLHDLAKKYGDISLVPDRRLKLKNKDVDLLLYVNDEIDGYLYKISQLELRQITDQLSEIPDQWYMIIGSSKHISNNDLFLFDARSKSFTWENDQVTNDELSEMVMIIEARRAAHSKEEELRKQSIKKQAYYTQQPSAAEVASSYEFTTIDSSPSNASNIDESINHYIAILNEMRNSSLVESAPGFSVRIKECEEDIQLYRNTGDISDRLHTYIRMMKNALQK